jgi:hypothetical protein
MILDDLKRFLTSGHVLHMEREIEYLRGVNSRLELELREALRPTPAPAVKRELPKFVPMKTNWEKYVEEQMTAQEKEENGTQS